MSSTINQQQDLLPAAFTFFEIEKDDIYCHHEDSDRKFYIEKKQYIKYQLNVDTDPDYSKLKVGYILNHCQYSKKYIRQCAVSRGVKITTDLNKADFIICNYDHSYYSGAFNLEYLNVIYRSHEEDLTVIHCNKFCEMKNEITIDIVDQLYAMWSNRQFDLINELLLNLTVKDPVAKWYCYIKLWSYRFADRASRDAKKWFAINNIDEFSGYNECDLIARLDDENSLSKENFKFLEKKAKTRVLLINAEIYKAKITLKDEYKKYL